MVLCWNIMSMTCLVWFLWTPCRFRRYFFGFRPLGDIIIDQVNDWKMQSRFSPIVFERGKLEQKFEGHRVSLFETHWNMYVLTSKGQDRSLTSGHVTCQLSNWVKIVKLAYHSIRIDELNTIRSRTRVYLFSVRSYRHKTCHMSGTKNKNFQVKFRFARISFLKFP